MSKIKNQQKATFKKNTTWHIAMTGMLSAISAILMFVEFSIPFMPNFIKLDISELPALIGAFTLGPGAGVAICLIKNLINLPWSQTGGVGELSNFILGASFVLTAGYIYKWKKTKLWGSIAAFAGALVMGIVSVFSNYYLVYPVYTAFMPMDAILAAYQAINPHVENLWQALLWFNMPFTIGKGCISAVITILVYKRLSPIIKKSES